MEKGGGSNGKEISTIPEGIFSWFILICKSGHLPAKIQYLSSQYLIFYMIILWFIFYLDLDKNDEVDDEEDDDHNTSSTDEAGEFHKFSSSSFQSAS